jgi:fructokinase
MDTVESVDAHLDCCVRGDPGTTEGSEVIAVVGEALVDLVLESGGRATPHVGGGAFNAARTLGRLGLRPLFVGRLSRDSYGRMLRRALEASGVRLDGIVETCDPTTFARVEVDGHGAASHRFYIDGTSAPGLLASDARAAMPSAPLAMHVGGLGLVFDPQASAIAALVAEAPPSTLILVDPNCRPAAVSEERAYRRRLQTILSRADVVKCTEDDLAYLEPDLPALDAARRLLDDWPSLVLLTRGNRGAAILTATRAARVEARAGQGGRHHRRRGRVRCCVAWCLGGRGPRPRRPLVLRGGRPRGRVRGAGLRPDLRTSWSGATASRAGRGGVVRGAGRRERDRDSGVTRCSAHSNEPVTSSTCSRRNHLLLVEGYEFWLIAVMRCAARVNV